MIFPKNLRKITGNPSVYKMAPLFKDNSGGESVKFWLKTRIARGGIKRCRKWGILSRDEGPKKVSLQTMTDCRDISKEFEENHGQSASLRNGASFRS